MPVDTSMAKQKKRKERPPHFELAYRSHKNIMCSSLTNSNIFSISGDYIFRAYSVRSRRRSRKSTSKTNMLVLI
ncbi:hypothetical protein E2C01_093937 [Portunus trituberculatus]|uniref:Uncharacterized protein n=1 Tax=Portunus trituberculatus TaxID=210409 RepID=A0A5B7JVV5_PORTR|nr:hypothetical protein [Portunus trituberculatus]